MHEQGTCSVTGERLCERCLTADDCAENEFFTGTCTESSFQVCIGLFACDWREEGGKRERLRGRDRERRIEKDTHIHTQTHKYTQIKTHTHTHRYTDTHTHTHTHT